MLISADGEVGGVRGWEAGFSFKEIERYKKALADKSVSLNEETRLKEKEEADARSKARKKELAQRSEAELMTIKNFGQTSLAEIKRQLDAHGLSLRSSI